MLSTNRKWGSAGGGGGKGGRPRCVDECPLLCGVVPCGRERKFPVGSTYPRMPCEWVVGRAKVIVHRTSLQVSCGPSAKFKHSVPGPSNPNPGYTLFKYNTCVQVLYVYCYFTRFPDGQRREEQKIKIKYKGGGGANLSYSSSRRWEKSRERHSA